MNWPKFWLHKRWQSYMLWPLSALVSWLARRRLMRFRAHSPQAKTLVIVVGNIVVGGAGKTPFIQYLVRLLQREGLQVGIISRGYGGKARTWPQVVTAESLPSLVGDEPVLLAKTLNCPIVVAPKRAEALEQIVAEHSLDVVISDDGLQHYGLARDIEIVLLDSARANSGLGNRLCLPAGPLREPVKRLDEVDCIVFNGHIPAGFTASCLVGAMQLAPLRFVNAKQPDLVVNLHHFTGQQGYAVAGIGNPDRFYASLETLGIRTIPLKFSDHYAYRPQDFAGLESEKPLFMTAKDAVKCAAFAQKNWWVLEIEPQCSETFSEGLLAKILHHPKLKGLKGN